MKQENRLSSKWVCWRRDKPEVRNLASVWCGTKLPPLKTKLEKMGRTTTGLDCWSYNVWEFILYR